MPLTALQQQESVDATACPDEVWAALYRTSPRAVLACRACGSAVHAKVSPRGLRFFAHDRRTPSCPSAGETPEHLGLKKAIAELIRAAGGTAIVEALPGAQDTGGWRADVLAVGESGDRVAFEVQLAAMTTAEGEQRTGKYAVDGIQTVWVTTRAAPWLYTLPGVQVDPDQEPLVAREGIAHLIDGAWQTRQGASLAELMPDWLAGRMSHVSGVHLSEQRSARWLFLSDAVVCAPVGDIRRWTQLEEQRRVAEQKAQAERAAYARNLKALYDRQERLLQVVVPEVAARAKDGQRIWLGVPPTPWDSRLPVALRDALGSEKTGHGCPIWTGESRQALSMRAVVCPVATAVGPGLGRSWLSRGVDVVVETQHEAERVAGALGWPLHHLKMRTAPALPLAPPAVQSTLTNAQRRDSQIRLLQIVVPRIAEEAGGADRVYLGRPQTRWDGRLPISRSQACGDKRHGGTNVLWVWTGASPSTASLHTIVSPNPAVLSPKTAARWGDLGVRVVVEDANEAAAVAHKFGTGSVVTVIDSE